MLRWESGWVGQRSGGPEHGLLCSRPQVPGSPEADFHPAGADPAPAAGDPGAAPRPARRDTGGQAGAAVPPGRSLPSGEGLGGTGMGALV